MFWISKELKSDELLDIPELNNSFMTVLGLWQRQNSTIMMGILATCSDITENTFTILRRKSSLMDITLNIEVQGFKIKS